MKKKSMILLFSVLLVGASGVFLYCKFSKNVVYLKRDQMQLQNLNEVLQSARVLPHIADDGKINGFLFQEIEEGSVFTKAGLQTGDVVTNINGTKTDNVGVGLEVLELLENEREIKIDVLREGKKEEITIRIQ